MYISPHAYSVTQPLDTNEAVCEYTQCGTIPNIWWSSTHMQCATIDMLPFVDNTLDSMIVGTHYKSTETVDIASNTSQLYKTIRLSL